MSFRPQRLVPALLAAALAGCCIRQPSSVDAVPGGWINLGDLTGIPTRKPRDGGGASEQVPGPVPPASAGETKPDPIPVQPAKPTPDTPGPGSIPTHPVPVSVPRVGGNPPPPVVVEGDAPAPPRPAPGPRPIGLPDAGKPVSPPAGEGRAAIPSLNDLGRGTIPDRPVLPRDQAPGAADPLSSPRGIPGLTTLPSSGSSAQPSLAGSPDGQRRKRTVPSPSLVGLAGQGGEGSVVPPSPDASAAGRDPEIGQGGFSLGIFPAAPSGRQTGVPVTPSLSGTATAPASGSLTSATLPSGPAPSASPANLSLGLFGREADGRDSGQPPPGAPQPGTAAQPASTSSRPIVSGGGASQPAPPAGSVLESPPRSATPAASALANPLGPDSPRGPASAPAMPTDIAQPRLPAGKEAAAVPSVGSSSPAATGLQPRTGAVDRPASSGAVRLTPGATTVAKASEPGEASIRLGSPAAASPLTASATSPRVALRPDSPSPRSDSPPAAAPSRPAASAAPTASLETRPDAAGTSPRAPAAREDAEAAGRRLEELKEEFAAYEREAGQLRAMLRRALGLDAPVPPEPPSREGEPIRLNDGGK